MLILEKDYSQLNNFPDRSVDLSRWSEQYNYLNEIHRSHQRRISELLDPSRPETDDGRYFLADLAGATVAKLVDSGLLSESSHRVALEGLRCCRTILLRTGYSPVTSDILLNELKQEEAHVALVPGCQGGDIRSARVRAMHNVANRLNPLGFAIAFAGKSPKGVKGREKVLEPNESRAMRVNWKERTRTSATSQNQHIVHEITTEETSNNTRQNVVEFLRKDSLFRRGRHNIYLVSSTFHLPRLATAFEEEVQEETEMDIGKIILVGAESHHKIEHDYVSSRRYVKDLYFNIWNYLLSNMDGRSQ